MRPRESSLLLRPNHTTFDFSLWAAFNCYNKLPLLLKRDAVRQTDMCCRVCVRNEGETMVTFNAGVFLFSSEHGQSEFLVGSKKSWRKFPISPVKNFKFDSKFT